MGATTSKTDQLDWDTLKGAVNMAHLASNPFYNPYSDMILRHTWTIFNRLDRSAVPRPVRDLGGNRPR